MSSQKLIFNPPPGWPKPPRNWSPPKGWAPDTSWPEPPPGWILWIPDESKEEGLQPEVSAEEIPAASATGEDSQSEADNRIAFLESEIASLRIQLEATSSQGEVITLDDEAVLQDIGIYRYHHPLETAVAYKERLTNLNARIAETVKQGRAIERSEMFTFNNSLAKGQRMANDLAKLMLRAYNAEADNSIRSLRAGNVLTGKKRLEASKTAIARHGKMMQMRISSEFHLLRIEEIELTGDFLIKKQEEREEAREERARLREEKKVAKELAENREKLNKERNHLLNALQALQETGEDDLDLVRRLAEVDDAIVQNDYRAANIRAGYVYVISNRGAFGEGVVKIGLTRRLEPLVRVNELGGASVPFRFDVHALFFSEDAVTLEADLHRHFAESRVNHANSRKEFFFATPAEVRDVLSSKVGGLLEFSEQAESVEYLQSLKYWPTSRRNQAEAFLNVSSRDRDSSR